MSIVMFRVLYAPGNTTLEDIKQALGKKKIVTIILPRNQIHAIIKIENGNRDMDRILLGAIGIYVE